MMVELTAQEIMLLQKCVEYRQRDLMQCEEMFKDRCAREYYDYRMSAMSDMIKKLSEVL